MDPDNSDTTAQYEGTRVGVITHFYDKISVAVVLAEEPIKKGDSIKIYDKEGNIVVEQSIDSMQIDMKDQEEVAKGTEFGLKVDGEVKEGYTVYRQ